MFVAMSICIWDIQPGTILESQESVERCDYVMVGSVVYTDEDGQWAMTTAFGGRYYPLSDEDRGYIDFPQTEWTENVAAPPIPESCPIAGPHDVSWGEIGYSGEVQGAHYTYDGWDYRECAEHGVQGNPPTPPLEYKNGIFLGHIQTKMIASVWQVTVLPADAPLQTPIITALLLLLSLLTVSAGANVSGLVYRPLGGNHGS